MRKSYQTCPWHIEEDAIQGLLWGTSPQADLFPAASTHNKLPPPSITFLPVISKMVLEASKHSGLGGWERLCSEQPPLRLMRRQRARAGTDSHCLFSCKSEGGRSWSYQAPTSTCAKRMLPKNGGTPGVLGAKGRSWCRITEVRETNGRAIYQWRVKRPGGGHQPQSIQLRMSSGCKLGEYPGKYYIGL